VYAVDVSLLLRRPPTADRARGLAYPAPTALLDALDAAAEI
jgi:hypothetical protein